MRSFRLYVVLTSALSAAAAGPYTLPIFKRTGISLSKRQNTGAIGLGDIQDVAYSILAKIGSDTIPLILDTGSSDIWSVSTDCTSSSCGSLLNTPKITASSLQATGVDVEIEYGDSTHGTSVSGLVVSGPVTLAGIQISDQTLGAVNKSTAGLEEQGISGIFGAGFPLSSAIFTNLIEKTLAASGSGTSAVTDTFVADLSKQGPMISRLVSNGQLQLPMYTITLQRETFDVGGNVGQLTLGSLPAGVSNDSLTWVPVRLYTESQGGIAGPSSNKNEVYPSRWEVMIDDVLINGQKLPKPTLDAGVGYSALIDSGTSFLAAPEMIVPMIYSSVSGAAAPTSTSRFSTSSPPDITCNNPVHLTFMIGGKPFPLDPRDFVGRHAEVDECTAGTLLPTDPPTSGALMSWILGSPFMKSNLVAFYFGNLTHPSTDPPRIGFLSTVPSNADDLYHAGVTEADDDGDYDVTSVSAPSTTFAAASTNSAGVAQASTDGEARATGSSGGSGGSGGSSGSGRSGGSGSSDVNGAALVRPSFALFFSAFIFGLWIC